MANIIEGIKNIWAKRPKTSAQKLEEELQRLYALKLEVEGDVMTIEEIVETFCPENFTQDELEKAVSAQRNREREHRKEILEQIEKLEKAKADRAEAKSKTTAAVITAGTTFVASIVGYKVYERMQDKCIHVEQNNGWIDSKSVGYPGNDPRKFIK